MSQIPDKREAFLFWLKLGFISFGGPAGQIAIMHDFLVEKKKWISESRFLHALNYCMLLPGPEAQQLATYIGWLMHGVLGGCVAGILFILPSVFILLGLSIIYVVYGELQVTEGILYLLKPAILAIIVYSMVKIAKKSLKSTWHFVVAILSFICVSIFKISFPLILLFTACLTGIALKFFPKILPSQKDDVATTQQDEASYLINKDTVLDEKEKTVWRLVFRTIVMIFLWLLPFLATSFLKDDAFWKQLSIFFTKTALVTFGGAYAVLPYVAQMSVLKFHWLTELQMMDGLALGETTPGPLIMVLAFVGFMAGYHQFESSIFFGTLALLVTTYYTFLPSFAFIFAGAPLMEQWHTKPWIKMLLASFSAAVVGMILNLCMFFGQSIIFPKGLNITEVDFISILWTIISFYVIYKLEISLIKWILASCVASFLWYGVKHLLVIA